ncbi:MAG: 50S ribosomal protein L32 [Kiritimatiellae bacterium]|nr:50S ribosomal protein L32 [Kiritimatiellia bacterium]
MASPKNRVSKMRKRQRVASLEKAIIASVQACPVCGGLKQAHHVCPNCGTYKGRKVLSVTAK